MGCLGPRSEPEVPLRRRVSRNPTERRCREPFLETHAEFAKSDRASLSKDISRTAPQGFAQPAYSRRWLQAQRCHAHGIAGSAVAPPGFAQTDRTLSSALLARESATPPGFAQPDRTSVTDVSFCRQLVAISKSALTSQVLHQVQPW